MLDDGGAVVASGPGAAGAPVAGAASLLWTTAGRAAVAVGTSGPEHVVVPVGEGAVVVVEAYGHRVVALTGPRPAVGLLLFDLRTCLSDAYGAGEDAR